MAVTAEQLDQAVTALNTMKNTYEQSLATMQALFDSQSAALAEAVAAIPHMYKSLHIDPVNGDDANSGGFSTPFKTLAPVFSILDSTYSGYIRLNLAPGVHVWDTVKTWRGFVLEIIAGSGGNADNVFLDYAADASSLTGGYLTMRGFTARLLTSANSAPHMKSMFRLFGGTATIGGYVSGAVSATNRLLHVISDGRPLLSSEVCGFFGGLEGVYAENTNVGVTPNIVESRGTSPVIYNHMNCAFSGFNAKIVSLQNASGVVV